MNKPDTVKDTLMFSGPRFYKIVGWALAAGIIWSLLKALV